MRELLIAVLLLSGFARADVYIFLGGLGTATGANCTNAAVIPSAASWVAGTTYHLCTGSWGTGSAGSSPVISVSSSGTNGNPITIIADQGAVTFQSAAFGTNGAVQISGSFVTFNGNNNLTIQNTQNGTGLANNQQSGGVVISGSNVTFEKTLIQNICQRASGDVGDSCTTGGNDTNGVQINGPVSNVTFTLNTVSQGGHSCVYYQGSSSDTGILLSYNTLSGCNWEIGSGSDQTNGFRITGNDISCVPAATCNWNEVADVNHHNGIMLFPQNAQNLNNVIIDNNYFHDINGNTTAYIFLDPSGTGNIPGAAIYNNVLFSTAGLGGASTGFIEPGVGVTGGYILNNTVYGPNNIGMTAQAASWTMENNVLDGQGCIESLTSAATSITSDYNSFFNYGTQFYCRSVNEAWQGGANYYTSLASFTSGTAAICGAGGCDQHSTTSSPPLNTTTLVLTAAWKPASGSNNLTSLCTGNLAGLCTGAPQFFGVNYACGTGCVARPGAGNWDMGAYPFSSSAPFVPSGQIYNGVTLSGGAVLK